MYYFAYGSNLSKKQMQRRCPGAKAVSQAVLRRYRLSFPRPDRGWRGGVAGITADQSGEVEGAIYELTPQHMQQLDAYEGVLDGAYYLAIVNVHLPADTDLDAYTYFAAPKPDGPFAPSPRYLATILEGARDHQLSDQWISQLQTLAVAICP